MICFNYHFWRVFTLLLLLAGGGQSWAASMPQAVDVAAAAHRLSLNESMVWCRADPDVTPSTESAGRCRWQSMSPQDVLGGAWDGVFWMRVVLTNSSTTSVERWIKLGHSRTAERSSFVREGEQWRRQDAGMSTPLDRRIEGPAAARGYLSVQVPARQQVEVLLRVRSGAWIDLRANLLIPKIAAVEVERRELLVLLAAGGLLLSLVFCLLLFVRMRRVAYLCFAAALSGETIVELHRSGILQQRFWPSHLAIPDYLMSIGGLLTLVGWMSFLFFFFPALQRPRRSLMVGVLLIGSSLLTLLWSIFIDYPSGLLWWGYLFVPAHLYGVYLCWLGMREVDRFRKALLWVLTAIFLFAIARVFFAQIIDASNSIALGLTPFALMLSMLLVLFVLLESAFELQIQLSRAEARSAGQVQFLAQMSHELRTPLDIVLGNAQLLLRGRAKMSEPVARDGLSSIIESARHLLGMIDEILGYARGLSGALPFRPEPVLLGEFLHAVDSIGQILCSRNRNRFVLRRRTGSMDVTQLVLMIDASRLRQVLDNLLVNASRHTREGLIALEYGVVDLGGAQVRLSFSVSDTGEGIAPEDHERIFLPFERAGRNAHASGKGTGMGLPTARQLVNLMGGEISVQSQLGEGASFAFDIVVPIGPVNDTIRLFEIDREPIEATGYLGERRTVLLIDDEQTTRRLLAALLIRLGFRVIEADSGRAAAELMRGSSELDLIITDQFMADGDGWDVLETAQQNHPDVATVLLSAAPPSPPDGWPLNRGFSFSLLKPVDHDVLLRRIGELLALKWVREKAAPEVGSAALVRPPVPELQALSRMVDLGEVTAIREWSTHLRRDYPQCVGFADEVEKAITMLDFKSIESLLGRASR
jgi:signal transduction histidine kinase/CheY-like chemotaxis protein